MDDFITIFLLLKCNERDVAFFIRPIPNYLGFNIGLDGLLLLEDWIFWMNKVSLLFCLS